MTVSINRYLNSKGIRAVMIFWSSLGALVVYTLIFGPSGLLALFVTSTIVLSIWFISFLVYTLGAEE